MEIRDFITYQIAFLMRYFKKQKWGSYAWTTCELKNSAFTFNEGYCNEGQNTMRQKYSWCIIWIYAFQEIFFLQKCRIRCSKSDIYLEKLWEKGSWNTNREILSIIPLWLGNYLTILVYHNSKVEGKNRLEWFSLRNLDNNILATFIGSYSKVLNESM